MKDILINTKCSNNFSPGVKKNRVGGCGLGGVDTTSTIEFPHGPPKGHYREEGIDLFPTNPGKDIPMFPCMHFKHCC